MIKFTDDELIILQDAIDVLSRKLKYEKLNIYASLILTAFDDNSGSILFVPDNDANMYNLNRLYTLGGSKNSIEWYQHSVTTKET